MTIESGELARRLGVTPTHLWRWRRQGWMTPALVRPARNAGMLWPGWCLRMGALLSLEQLGSGPHPPPSAPRRSVLAQVAETLAVFPDTPYVVIIDGLGLPAHDAALVVALHEHHRSGSCTTVVAVPALAAIP